MRSWKGFTLIELLIVVAIIAILALIAVPNFLEAQVRAKVSRSKADMRTLATAIEAYATEYNKYPIDGSRLGDGPFWYVPNAVTTPISFISSSKLVDPFRIVAAFEMSLDPDSTGWTVNDYRRYRYRNFPYTYGSAAGAVYDTIYGIWELMGNGPDRSAGPFVYRTINGRLMELTLPYDPTNGTVSTGNLIRCQKYSDGMAPVWGP
jgi:prepilin-type N-terminal cleavage/methylation domain-containing protein